MGKKGSGPRFGRGVAEDFSKLPVFCLTGGTEGMRSAFIASLETELAKYSLQPAIVQKADCQSWYAVSLLAQRHDLVVINAATNLPGQSIAIGQLEKKDSQELCWSGPGSKAMRSFMTQLVARLDELVRRTPVWGCVLIGGKSSRMGQPKHLIQDTRGRTWLENIIRHLHPLVDGLVVSGSGDLPAAVAETPRLADIPGVVGPLTGIVAACRWQPRVSWLVVACDMPHISAAAIRWLLADRRAGSWGRVPKLAGNDHCEPLFAWYDFRSAQLFEEQLFHGNLRIGDVAGHPRLDNPVVPEQFRYAFANVNTPAELPRTDDTSEGDR